MLLSQISFIADGTETTYHFPFPRLSDDFIFVSINGVDTDEFVFEASTSSVILNVSPEGGSSILLQRRTPVSIPLVDFSDNSTLNEEDLDTAVTQIRHAIEEARDLASSALNLDLSGVFNALKTRISCVADGIDPEDAANIRQLGEATAIFDGLVDDINSLVPANLSATAAQVAADSATAATEATEATVSATAANVSRVSAEAAAIAAQEDAAEQVNLATQAATAAQQAATASEAATVATEAIAAGISDTIADTVTLTDIRPESPTVNNVFNLRPLTVSLGETLPPWLSISGNNCTFLPGSYEVHGVSAVFAPDRHMARFIDPGDASIGVFGTSHFTDSGSGTSILHGRVTFTNTRVFQLQHFTSDGRIDGFNQDATPIPGVIEPGATLFIRRLSQ